MVWSGEAARLVCGHSYLKSKGLSVSGVSVLIVITRADRCIFLCARHFVFSRKSLLPSQVTL